MRQRSRKTDELLLARGETGATLAHGLLETLRKGLDEIQQINALGGFGKLSVGNSRSAQADVLGDGSGEQVRILQYHSEIAPQLFQIEFANVDSADADVAALHFI